MRQDDIAIDIQGLVKDYHPRSGPPVRALDGLSLQVRAGEIYGLLGRNGAGKTTLLRVLTTLVTPSAGSASVLGFDVRRDPLEVRRRLCVVLQQNAVELFLSVQDNLATYARFHAIPRREIPGRIARVLEQFGLEEHRNQKVNDLSGGLMRRVQVAKVFMIDRPVIILDEATTGMDPINKRATLDAVREQARQGRTIFLTTHILEEAEELCDTIALIDRGRVIAAGDLPTIKSRVARALDVSVTFGAVTPELLEEFQRLPLLKCEQRGNTIHATLRSGDVRVLETIAHLSRTTPVVHLEVQSATLEDVFFELLAPEGKP
jgi:ABC-2 type transport system ATP-binding protein